MKPQLKSALIWFITGMALTAIILVFVIVTALLIDRPITFKTFWMTYLIFGAPFAISALCVLVAPEWYLTNDSHAIVMGFVSIWGAPIVDLAIPNLEIVWCFVISACVAALITHYLRLRSKAQSSANKE